MNERHETEIRHAIGSGGSLALRNVSGRMRLLATDGDEAVVRVTAHDGSVPNLNVERGESSLLVEPERSGLGFNVQIGSRHQLDFDVELPRGARVDVKTVSADVVAEGLAGEQRFKAVSGDIRLDRSAGRVSAMTVSGDVRLHDAGDLELDTATTSGDLTVEARLLRQLDVKTVSGDVRIAGRLQPGPRHSVETVSGDLGLEATGGVTVESRRALDFARRGSQPIVVGDGAARLVFRSMSGDQRVRLQETAENSTQPPSEQQPAEPAPATDERLAVLRALERGEIDVDEASRRLEAASRG